MHLRLSVVAVVLAAVAAAGCSASTDVGTEAADGAGAAPGVALTSAEIYTEVSPSIVFIETPDESTASGIVVEGGWVVTNAHVADRHPEVRIGRSDGVDLGDFPVVAQDWVFDLALIGPIDDAGLTPITRDPSADLTIGDRVLLLGFPDESSSDPTPTLTEGIVNRRRRPALGDFPFIQVDATIAPGQSGGALLDEAGRFVGLSSLEFGLGEFALAFEADAMWPRIDQMLAETGPVFVENPVDTIVEEIGPHRRFAVIVDTSETGTIDLSAESLDDVYIELQTLGGVPVVEFADFDDAFERRDEDEFYYVDEELEGTEQLIADVEPGRYQVTVGSFAPSPGEVTIRSASPMHRLLDVEEGATLPVGEIVEGELDWAHDSDRWRLELVAGEQITITADGMADTILTVRLDGVPVAASDDEGLGMFGTGSQVSFAAETDGEYEVEVGTFDGVRWGYLLEVTKG